MLLFEYVWWHYAIAPLNIVRIARDYLAAVRHKFFISRHLRTLFAPWHRVRAQDIAQEAHTLGESVENAIGTVVADVFFRLIAASIRTTIIVLGLAVEALTFAAFIALFLVWLAWPVLALVSVGAGIILL